MTPSAAATAINVIGSDALTPNASRFSSVAETIAAAAPMTMPVRAGFIPSITNSRSTSPVDAPSAVRMPISRRRPRTMCESTL